MNKIYFSIAAIFLCVGIGLGVIIGMNFNKSSKLNKKYNAPNTFDAGWESAKKKIEETPYIPTAVMGQNEVKTIKGKILEVNSDKIKIEARLFNPLDDEKLKNRIVKIDSKTEIIIRKDKKIEEINKEQEEFNKKMEDFRNNKISIAPSIPDIYTEKKGTIADLQVGQNVTVESVENIRDAAEFSAIKILAR